MRMKILGWENQGYLPTCGAELTYHPNSGFLQAVLDLHRIGNPSERTCELSQEVIEQIPKEIMEYIESLRSRYHITREVSIRDHEEEMDKERRKKEAVGEKYYNGLPNKEIMRICSIGTKIALEILSMLEEDRGRFKDDLDLRRYIDEQIREKLGSEPLTDRYSIELAWHETCNPLGIWKNFSVMIPLGFQNEEELVKTSTGNQALGIIKDRSLDCRIRSL
jgi:hypothetical protein